MALGRQEKREVAWPLLTETARLWHCPVAPTEPYPISRLAGRLDTSLDFSGGVPLWLPRSPESAAEEQALDLRVARRRRADSLDRSPSPTESESTLGSPGRSPRRLSHAALSGGSTGGLSPLTGSLAGSLAGSPPGLVGTPSSPPTLSYVFRSPAAGDSICGSPPQLRSVCSSPPQFGSICSSPASPGSPDRVARGRQTSVIRRLVLERPTQRLEELQPTEPHPEQLLHAELPPQQQQQQQQPDERHEDHLQQQQQQQQYPCDQCGRKYSTASNLARHRQLHCLPADKKARKCPECDKIYVSMPAYSMHVRTHSQGCRCPYCGKSFSRPWLLQGHVRTHTGERPFRCSVCAKAFADKSNLRAHVQTHSNVKPHVCQRCGKAFALKSYLYKHEESSCMKERRNSRGGSEPAPTVKVEMQSGV